ncbi:unnamed protein product [Protopolystoma xenopodis]|uniref:Ig-like domain-containing protein n=1 Tax=Protopolystoma xenopodis TaxID=117903 RepID=A0A3S5CBI6_9PLAT|nr:unnamed protein product [Protopolystoma xenopodis]
MKSIVKEGKLPSAPVEVCDCQLPGESTRDFSLSCEGCTDPTKRTEIRLEPFGEDHECVGCFGSTCPECKKGEFKYDFVTQRAYETCQKGLVMETKGRVVQAEEGESVSMVCRIASYRGGAPVHTWEVPDGKEGSLYTVFREALPTIQAAGGPSYAPIRSQVTISWDSVTKGDAGVYKCQAAGLGSNLTEQFYLMVGRKGEYTED